MGYDDHNSLHLDAGDWTASLRPAPRRVVRSHHERGLASRPMCCTHVAAGPDFVALTPDFAAGVPGFVATTPCFVPRLQGCNTARHRRRRKYDNNSGNLTVRPPPRR